MKNLKTIGLFILLSVICNTQAFAQTTCAKIDCMADGLIPQVTGVIGIIVALSYLLGLVFTYKAIMKFKEYSESKQGQVKLIVPIMMLFAAACFISLPSYINIGIETLNLDKAGATKLGNY